MSDNRTPLLTPESPPNYSEETYFPDSASGSHLPPKKNSYFSRSTSNISRMSRASRTHPIASRFLLIVAAAVIFTIGTGSFKFLFWGDDNGISRRHIPLNVLIDSFLSTTEAESAKACAKWSKVYTKDSHLAGENQDLVDFTKTKFHEFGLTTVINPYYVYLNTPINSSVTVYQENSPYYYPSMREDLITDKKDDIPSFHGYSANGNVTGQYIWANYGTKQDFEHLISKNISIEGKIVLVKYGKIYRGLKVKFAQEAGAIGVIIYTDPKDDGEITKENGYEEYPNGPARNPSSIQRGSVLFLSYLPGDPTTPGYPSKKNAKRKDPHSVIPKIPSIPMSYKDVLPILETLKDKGVKYGYSKENSLHTGPNPNFTLNLFNDQKYEIRPIYNVIGDFKGIIEDEVIILGNHRDAWIKGGASDPNSGSAVMLEIIRNLNNLKAMGWKPLRTIMFASWDGEEIGLIGSTEFVEDASRALQKNVVAYLNLDGAVSGTLFEVGSSPILNDIIFEVMKKIKYPTRSSDEHTSSSVPKSVTLFDHFNEFNKDGISILGSGSDFTAFLEHIGIPSMNAEFGPNPTKDPIYHYHSNYDNWNWMNEYGDPTWEFHKTMAQFYGVLILELCETEVLKFNVHTYITEILLYYKDIKSMITITDKLKEGDKRDLKVITDATLNRLYKLQEISKWYMQHLESLQDAFDHSGDLSYWNYLKLLREIKLTNRKLKLFERSFIAEKGLNGREWFKHLIYASGRYTGYEGQSLPGLREAVEDSNVEDFKAFNQLLVNALHQIETQF